MADAWFRSPLLRGLDARGRADVRAAGTVHALALGAVPYLPGEPADTLWFVGEGALALAVPWGVRPLGPGDHFGVDALVRGAVRGARIAATAESLLLELPVTALRRILERAGADTALVREEARARRHAFAELLSATPLGKALSERELFALARELTELGRERGQTLVEPEAPALAALLVARGLVEVRGEGVASYGARGDVLGLEQTLRGEGYGFRATALGDVLALALPRSALVEIARRSPEALERQVAHLALRSEKQRQVRELVQGGAARHGLDELGRLESARSLLVIDANACVRCGHCVSACAETHGTPRMERRGELASLAVLDAVRSPRQVLALFPQACQHCRDPACLVECGVGAIMRDASGAVQIAESACTGCGACAKACPWDAIRMAPRAGATGTSLAAAVAVKCDLCAGGDGPECVSACPTNAIVRLEPRRDLVEARGALGGGAARAPERRRAASFSRLVLAAAAVPPLVALARVASSGERWRLASGIVATCLALLLAAQALVKRVRPLRARVTSARGPVPARRGLRSFVWGHAGLGSVMLVAVACHTGARLGAGTLGALACSFWLLAASGAAGALAYRALPARLSRLESRGTLPEDWPAERAELEQRLFSGLTAQNLALKTLAARVLLPYAGSRLGALALACSGRSPAAEVARLQVRLAGLLGGHASPRLAPARALLETAVSLRALRARRLLAALLGGWLPLHVVLSAVFWALLGLHVLAVCR